MLHSSDMARARARAQARARVRAPFDDPDDTHTLLLGARALMENALAPPGLLSAAHWCVSTNTEVPWSGADTFYLFDVAESPYSPRPASPPPPPPLAPAARDDTRAYALPASCPMRCPWCRAFVDAIGAGALPARACELCSDPARRICQLLPCNHASACRECLVEWARKSAATATAVR